MVTILIQEHLQEHSEIARAKEDLGLVPGVAFEFVWPYDNSQLIKGHLYNGWLFNETCNHWYFIITEVKNENGELVPEIHLELFAIDERVT